MGTHSRLCVLSPVVEKMQGDSIELDGLEVVVDRLVHHKDPIKFSDKTPHAFIYFLTIRNNSNRTVTLKARKWVINNFDGETLVIEGDKIVGQTPEIVPGDKFSYNSYHLTAVSGRAHGSFHGTDDTQQHIHVKIPLFEMLIPESDACY